MLLVKSLQLDQLVFGWHCRQSSSIALQANFVHVLRVVLLIGQVLRLATNLSESLEMQLLYFMSYVAIGLI